MTFLSLSPFWRAAVLLLGTVSLVMYHYLTVRYLHLGRSRRIVLSSALFLVLQNILMQILQQHHMGDLRAEIRLPLWVTLAFLAASLLLGGIQMYMIRSWRESSITSVSVQESFDTLPSGLCVYQKNGLLRLVNTKMTQICRELTGGELTDAEGFWSALCAGALPGCISAGSEPIYRLTDGSVFSFKRAPLGRTSYELTAGDVTEEYQLTLSLEEKNKQARLVSARLDALMKTMEYLVMERELVTLKTQLHDNLGRALLLTRRFLAAPESVAEKDLLAAWDSNVRLLKNEQPEFWQKPYYVSLEHAAALGVNVQIEGELPAERNLIGIIDTAINVHVTNALRHAAGTNVLIRSVESPDAWHLVFTNDGAAPAGTVREGTGLSNLRRLTEDAGGTMRVVSAPNFELTLLLPKEGSANA